MVWSAVPLKVTVPCCGVKVSLLVQFPAMVMPLLLVVVVSKVPPVIVRLLVMVRSSWSWKLAVPPPSLKVRSLKSSALEEEVVMVFVPEVAFITTLPVPGVKVPVEDTSQLPDTVKEVSSCAVGAVRVPEDMMIAPLASMFPEEAVRVPPLMVRVPVVVKVLVLVEISKVPAVMVVAPLTVMFPSD